MKTRDFRTTVRARVQREPALRRALFREAVDCFRSGEPEVGKNILRYIPATQAAKVLKEAGKEGSPK
jgi:hypothetical protein